MKIKNNVYGKTYRILLDLLMGMGTSAFEHNRIEMETIVATYAQDHEEDIFDDTGNKDGN